MNQTRYLDRIIDLKKCEITHLIEADQGSYKQMLKGLLERQKKPLNGFGAALKKHDLAVIAEIKRTSPSKGMIGEIVDPSSLALQYCQGGASAISILTDHVYFGGSLEDLKTVSHMLGQKEIKVPTLRKDFIIHELQLCEAVVAGASAVLLIAAVLGQGLKRMMRLAEDLGLEVLTEIHDEDDLEIALEAGAKIIGVNNRDLRSFEIDLKTSEKLHPLIPRNVITVSESGIFTPEQALRMRNIGYDAILVGEALVKSNDPSSLIIKMKRGKHEN